MLIIQKKHEDTLVLHAILGDESKHFMDIHGGIVMNVGQMVASAVESGHTSVLMMLTRCDSERDTAEFISAQDHLMPVGADGKPMKLSAVPCCDHKTDPNKVSFQPPAGKPTELPLTKCAYCGDHKILLPIVGVRICAECALIELKSKQAQQLRAVAEDTDVLNA